VAEAEVYFKKAEEADKEFNKFASNKEIFANIVKYCE